MKNPLLPLLLCALACTAAQAATITVNDDADAQNQTGICTLRDAVASVNAGADQGGCVAVTAPNGYGTNDTIEFDSSLTGATIPVVVPDATGDDSNPGGGINIEKNLTITGPTSGAADITLNANPGHSTPGTNRIFNVPSTSTGARLTITGVTFRNGNADSDDGGAIEVDTGNLTLTLEQCAFEGNQAEYGGAVDIDSSSSTVIIRNSTFSGNEATSNGGAVYAYNTATISNSTFSGNEANDDGGGAVYANDTATIRNSTFSGNEATRNGGAVYADNATIRNSTFSGNTATEDGGAVWVGGTATISNSTFSGNEAYGSGEGGAAVNATTATISNSTFSGNRATNGNSGAVYAFFSLDARHLTLLNNTAGTDGQALYVNNSSGTATLHNSIIIGSNGNSSAQCVKNGGTFTGSYNLEGYEASGSWNNASPATCGTPIAPSPTDGTSLNTIVESTLADHGGPTQTLALPTGSPAIGAADGAHTEPLDQRGSVRDSAPDIGAYEWNALTITGTLPDGTVGVGYTSGNNLTANGGTPFYTFIHEITRGALPPGLTLDASGELQGTPSRAGTYTFAITVKDDTTPDPLLAGGSFTVTIQAAPPVPPSSSSSPIPVLPVPLLLGLMALVGTVAVRQRRR